MPAPTMPPMPIDTAAAMPIWPVPVIGAGGGVAGVLVMLDSRGGWDRECSAIYRAAVSEMISIVVPWMM